MKKLVLITLVAFSIISCQFREEITLKEDGSGVYNLKIDMGQMVSQMKSQAQDGEKQEKKERVDSTILFKDVLTHMDKKDLKKLSKEEKEALNRIKDLKLHMLVDEEKGEMLMDFSMDFKSLAALKTIGKDIQKATKIKDKEAGKKGENPMGEMFNGLGDEGVDYSYNGSKFTRKSVVSKAENTEKAVAEDTGNMDLMKMFSYKLVYHFPKKIKSVSYKDAMLGTDGKTLIIDVPLDKMESNPKLLDFEVLFE